MAGEVYIDFSATGQKLERADDKTVAAGAANALYCRFGLNEAWEYYAHVFARFRRGGAVYDVEVANGVACVPWEVCQYSGFEVALHGHVAASGSSNFENNRLTTNTVLVDVVQTIDAAGVEPIGYTPTLMDMLLQEASNAQAAAQEVQEQAAAGDFTGTVDIGTVTTGEPGTAASVENVGTPQAAVLNFTIPKGDTGAAGDITNVTVTDIPAASMAYVNLTPIRAKVASVGKLAMLDCSFRIGAALAAGEVFGFAKPISDLRPPMAVQAVANAVDVNGVITVGNVQLTPSTSSYWSLAFPSAVPANAVVTLYAVYFANSVIGA